MQDAALIVAWSHGEPVSPGAHCHIVARRKSGMGTALQSAQRAECRAPSSDPLPDGRREPSGEGRQSWRGQAVLLRLFAERAPLVTGRGIAPASGGQAAFPLKICKFRFCLICLSYRFVCMGTGTFAGHPSAYGTCSTLRGARVREHRCTIPPGRPVQCCGIERPSMCRTRQSALLRSDGQCASAPVSCASSV